MGDPLSDPRAQKLLSASTGEISSLAGAFRSVGTQAEVAAAGLRGAQNDATWTGSAASAFRAQVGKLPGQLDKVQHSYNEVATALYRYESGLGPVQSQFKSLATQLNSARSSLSTAQGQLTTARSDLTTATSAPHAKPTSPAVVNAHTALNNAATNVGNLQGQVSGLESRGYQLLDEFDTIRGHARSVVSSAAGIAPSQSWLSGALHDLGNAMGDVGNWFVGAGKFLYGVGKGVVDDIGNLPTAIANVYDHPGDLKAWGTLVKDVAVTASVVAMVAAPFAAPELAEADAAVDGAAALTDGAEGTAEAASTASRFGTAMRGVSNWGGRASTASGLSQSGIDAGQGDWRAAALDVGFAAAPNLGSVPKSFDDIKGFGDLATNAFGIGDKAASSAAEDYTALSKAQGSVADYQQFREWGLSPQTAQSMAFDNGVPDVLKGTNLDSAASYSQALAGAQSRMQSTAATAMHIGRPVAGIVDKVAAEPLQEKIKSKLDPAAAQ
jgi:uncharacterized protein YukE